jgi:gluconolactonase
MDRRAFLTSSAVAATATALGTPAAAETEGQCSPTRVPLSPSDSHIESLDSRFKVSEGESAVEQVATGFGWAEGPVYFAAGRYLVFSDIPRSRMMRLLDDDNRLSIFRKPSMMTNGNTVDRQGRLYSCEQAERRVTRTEHDGSITVIADHYNGKKLNAPNDIVVASNAITHPLFEEAWAGGSDRVQARVPTMTAKGLAPLSLAVSTVVRTSASASAAHMAR